jgi:NTF2 fold immunity protein
MKAVASERPFVATLEDDVRLVKGTLHCPGVVASGDVRCVGGVALVQITKAEGLILLVIHGK